MILVWCTSNTADFIFGKKQVLVNYANDLTVKGSAILLFQTVKFVYWSLFNKENIIDRVHTYSMVTTVVSCFSRISGLLKYFMSDQSFML